MTRIAALTAFLCLAPLALHAQSWRAETGRATAPASISGDRAGGFEVVCQDGRWYMFVFTNASVGTLPSPATVTVDAQAFASEVWWYGDGEEGIGLTPEVIAALKQGSRITVAFGGFSATFALRGSSRALDRAEASCRFATPSNASFRFIGAQGESQEPARALTRQIMADDLATMRAEASKPDIDVDAAWQIDLGEGWQGIVAYVGPSIFHHGVAAFGTEVFIKPPSADWQSVGPHAPAFSVQFDTLLRNGGWPRLVYQSDRGVNQPYVFWQWDGTEYVFERRVSP